jgi:putative oxidoreductase
MTPLGLLVLRLTVAVGLIAHGGHQLFGAFAGPGVGPGGLTATAARLGAAGIEPGFPMAVLAGVIQLSGGLLIAVGLLTRWASVAVLIYLGIVVWKDQMRWGFFLNWVMDPGRGHGLELSLLFAGSLLCLVLAGGGDYSLDGRRANAAAARASGRARLRTRA